MQRIIHCIPPDATLNNVKAMMKAIHYWNKIKKDKDNVGN